MAQFTAQNRKFGVLLILISLAINSILGYTVPIINYDVESEVYFIPKSSSTNVNYSKWDKPIDVRSVAEQYDLTGRNITIAFVDTGINLSHECFQRFSGNIPYYSVDDPNSFGNPFKIIDVQGHGTHATSLALGNSSNFQGIAPNADCIVVNIFNKTKPTQTTPARLIQAFDWLIKYHQNHKIDIISLSIGAFIGSVEEDILAQYIKNFTSQGIIVVASAGNGGGGGSNSIFTPGTAAQSITVGAMDADYFELYSNSGQGPTWDGIIKPDLVAPGVNELGADYKTKDSYISMTGTSQATPIVSGIIALLLEFGQRNNISFRWEEIKWILSMAALNFKTNNSLLDIEKNNKQGWGIIQLGPVVQLLKRNLTMVGNNVLSPKVVTVGGLDHSIVSIVPVQLKAYQNYRFILNSSDSDVVQLGLFDSHPNHYGEPSLLYSSVLSSKKMIAEVDNDDLYYLVLKIPYIQEEMDISIIIELYDNSALFLGVSLIMLLIYIIALIGLTSALEINDKAPDIKD
jgi:subtilase family protein